MSRKSENPIKRKSKRFLNMWLRELKQDFKAKESGVHNLNFLWHNNNIYIMDNHLAAAFCWLKSCKQDENYNFIHIDQHRDFLCNHPIEAYNHIRTINTITDYCGLQYKGRPLFQWDNYIKPMQLIFPKWFSYNVFSTQEGQVDKTIQLLVPHMCIDYIEPDELKESLNECFKQEDYLPYTKNKWIVNIDLDVFFDENCKRLFDNEYIQTIASIINKNMNRIQVLILCLSPDCCSDELLEGWNKSISVLNTFCNQIDVLRGKIFPNDYN